MNKIDWTLLLPAIFLVLFGLATFFSIDREIFNQQAIFLILGVGAYFLFLYLPVDLYRFYFKFSYFLILVCLVLVFIIGIEARGSIRWVEFFGISIQFSEVLKPLFVLFFASYIAQAKTRDFLTFFKSLLLFSPVFFLILRQPDLGSAVIYFFTLIGLLVVAGFSLFYFVILFVLLLIPMPLIFNFLHAYQKERIFSFFNQTGDPFGSSYNAVQSIISVGSGGFMGKGFGQATQSILRFLPERHTDFIFATISESLGFVGGMVILVIYCYILFRIYKTARLARSEYESYICFAFFFLFLTHIFFNIGMNIGILPIVGITLPFLSYGGSSLVTNFMILGILSSISNVRRSFGGTVEIR